MDLAEFQQKLGYQFQDAALLRQALTHPSVLHEKGTTEKWDNQRLEFLGDAVLGLALSQELFEKFPSVPEGGLTKARAEMVKRHTLAAQARRLGLGNFLILSRGEELNGGRQRPSALADAFEALLGAVFLDAGFDRTRELVLNLFREGFGELEAIPNLDNPKGELQEFIQSRSAEPPKYHLISTSGPDHDRVFLCSVTHEGAELGRGSGKSKREAESQAALAALEKLRTPGNPPKSL